VGSFLQIYCPRIRDFQYPAYLAARGNGICIEMQCFAKWTAQGQKRVTVSIKVDQYNRSPKAEHH
jgi:hypothetical protein